MNIYTSICIIWLYIPLMPIETAVASINSAVTAATIATNNTKNWYR